MSDLRPIIAALETKRTAALLTGDYSTLAAITHRDFIHVDARGELRDREAYLASVASGSVRLLTAQTSETGFVVHGDLVLVTGLFRNELQTSAGIEVRAGRHCRAYVRDGGSWLNIMHQSTEIA